MSPWTKGRMLSGYFDTSAFLGADTIRGTKAGFASAGPRGSRRTCGQ